MIDPSFMTGEALTMNKARLAHLHSLQLPIANKTVNEYGSGPGLLTPYFIMNKCKIHAWEARKNNVDAFRELHAMIPITEFDLEHGDWNQIEESQIGFAYGLLYHLGDPKKFLENVARKTKEILILETIVLEDTISMDYMEVEEEKQYAIQSYTGKASRPTRKYVWNTLKELFGYVYMPKTQPNYADFPLQFHTREHHTMRFIVVASHTPLHLSSLSETWLDRYESQE